MKPKIISGWQFNVELHKDYVIKTPRSKKEVTENAKRYLKHIGKLNELKKRVDRVIKDIETSKKIIEKNKIPKSLLAHPIYLKDGKVKQKRVTVFKEKIEQLEKRHKHEEIKILVKKAVGLIKKFWEYGAHETTFKFYANFGVDKDKVILLDIFELTDKKSTVEKQIKKRSWVKKQSYGENPIPLAFDYFIKEADKQLTLKELNKLWRRKLK